jgi:nitroreductase
MKAEELNTIIRQRRSVFPKDYTGEKIADSIIIELLENANWAPTHKLTEPWRFKVFCDEGLQEFAKKQADHYYYKHYGTDKFLDKKHKKLLNGPLKSSHIIAIGMHRSHEVILPEIEDVSAVACAVQNILLSAHAYGLGAYWSTGGLTYVEEAKSFFDLGSEDKLLGFIYLGVKRTPSQVSARKPIADKVSWYKK